MSAYICKFLRFEKVYLPRSLSVLYLNQIMYVIGPAKTCATFGLPSTVQYSSCCKSVSTEPRLLRLCLRSGAKVASRRWQIIIQMKVWYSFGLAHKRKTYDLLSFWSRRVPRWTRPITILCLISHLTLLRTDVSVVSLGWFRSYPSLQSAPLSRPPRRRITTRCRRCLPVLIEALNFSHFL